MTARMWRFGVATAASAAVFAFVGSTWAQDLPTVNLKVIGSFSNVNMSISVEKPFWTKKLPEASGGKISVDFTTLDALGLKGTETLRLIRIGVADFASGPVSYMAGDFKLYDGLDLAGLFLDIKTMRTASEAYKPILSKNMEKNFNAKYLFGWPSPPQVIYCRDKMSGLGDLKGRKIRGFNQTLADFVEGIGGTAVTIAFPEVVPALQRGTADCAITGTLSGNTAKWWEVTDYLYPLVVGWAPWFHAVNLKTWNKLDKKTQDFLIAQFKTLEDEFWAVAAKEAQDGINCNTGKGECIYGVKGAMTLVPVTDGDKKTLAKVLSDVVVPRWAERCGADCVKDWNDTVGKVVNITVPTK